MFIEIIKNTPVWVFILLLGLIYLGYTQSKNREVAFNKIFILPISMLILSIFGIFSAFGLVAYAWVFWLLGEILSILIGLKYLKLNNTSYNSEKKSFHIQGSWTPMFIILLIFSLKYFVGFAIARQLPIVDTFEFLVIVSFLYGALSGVFLSKTAALIKYRKTFTDK